MNISKVNIGKWSVLAETDINPSSTSLSFLIRLTNEAITMHKCIHYDSSWARFSCCFWSLQLGSISRYVESCEENIKRANPISVICIACRCISPLTLQVPFL